jgi:hypothetical protein
MPTGSLCSERNVIGRIGTFHHFILQSSKHTFD